MRAGFVFSLDAFVAFTLIIITISFLVFTISTPKAFYPSLQQAHQLAYDTLQVLATAECGNLYGCSSGETYLEKIVSGSNINNIMLNVVGDNQSNGTIPIGYGYKLEEYDFSAGGWNTLFDVSDSNLCSGSCRFDKNYTKLKASVTLFTSIYEDEPETGDNLFGYINCYGTSTPCAPPMSTFEVGNYTTKLMRLTVYT